MNSIQECFELAQELRDEFSKVEDQLDSGVALDDITTPELIYEWLDNHPCNTRSNLQYCRDTIANTSNTSLAAMVQATWGS